MVVEKNQIFNLDVLNDPISDLFEKYGISENSNLPIAKQDSALQIHKFIQNLYIDHAP